MSGASSKRILAFILCLVIIFPAVSVLAINGFYLPYIAPTPESHDSAGTYFPGSTQMDLKGPATVIAGENFTLTMVSEKFPATSGLNVYFWESFEESPFQLVGRARFDEKNMASLKISKRAAGNYIFQSLSGPFQGDLRVKVLPSEMKNNISVEKGGFL